MADQVQTLDRLGDVGRWNTSLGEVAGGPAKVAVLSVDRDSRGGP